MLYTKWYNVYYIYLYLTGICVKSLQLCPTEVQLQCNIIITYAYIHKYNICICNYIFAVAFVQPLSHISLFDPIDCSLSGSSVHGIFQARILEWVAISSSRGSSPPRDRIRISCISCTGRQVLCHWATWEAHNYLRNIQNFPPAGLSMCWGTLPQDGIFTQWLLISARYLPFFRCGYSRDFLRRWVGPRRTTAVCSRAGFPFSSEAYLPWSHWDSDAFSEKRHCWRLLSDDGLRTSEEVPATPPPWGGPDLPWAPSPWLPLTPRPTVLPSISFFFFSSLFSWLPFQVASPYIASDLVYFQQPSFRNKSQGQGFINFLSGASALQSLERASHTLTGCPSTQPSCLQVAIPSDSRPTDHKLCQHSWELLCRFQTYSRSLFQPVLTIAHKVERVIYTGPSNIWVLRTLTGNLLKRC